MVKRKLTKSEHLLWQKYIEGIESLNTYKDVHFDDRDKTRYQIKIPETHVFSNFDETKLLKHSQPYVSLENQDKVWGKKLKQGKRAIDGKIDLHGMTRNEAKDKLYRFLLRAQKSGKKSILVVTGKGNAKQDGDHDDYIFGQGRGVLKREVPIWLSEATMKTLIVSYQDAAAHHGGSGALYVILKRLK